jgi:phosphatidylglycerophosphatase C
MNLVLFDFDGTITTRDSFWLLIFFTHKIDTIFFKLIKNFPGWFLFKLGILSSTTFKEKVLSSFYKDIETEQFNAICFEFISEIQKYLRKNILIKLDHYLASGDDIVVVSASCSSWIKPFCDTLGLKLIATEMGFTNHRFSGKLKTANCKGGEKVRRIIEELDLTQYEKIIAYGDSKSDLPMINLADEKHYRDFL